MSRLPIKPSVLKQLFGLSGNRCAYPGCTQPLFADGTGYVEICHIAAAEKGGPRYREDMDDEQRRAIENLILLCRNHHGQVDDRNSPITGETLLTWKRNHEAPFSDVRHLFRAEVIDIVGARTPKPPTNLRALLATYPSQYTPGDVAGEVAPMTAFMERIRNLTPGDLGDMELVIRHCVRGADKERLGGNGLRIDANEAAQILRKDPTQLAELCRRLEHYGIGSLDEDFDGWTVNLNSPTDWIGWRELASAAQKLGVDLHALLQDQDFTILDA